MSIKISELPAATSVGNNDVLPIVQSGTTKKAAASLIKTSISSTINSSSTNDTAAGSKAVYDYSAPISHSTSATTYGVGTASNYGHCKTINNLTTGSYVAGEALSAYQGKVLDDAKEDVANKTNTIDENSTSTQYPNAEATYQAISTLEGNLSAEISNLQAENEALLNQIPTYTATGTSINVKDSSNLPIKDFALLGNASQNGTPTPDSPIPIQVVTGDNTLVFTGKNLFDKDNAVWKKEFLKDNGNTQVGTAANNSLMPSNYYNVKPSTTYHLSFDYGTDADDMRQILVCEYDINKNHILRTNIISTNTLTTQNNTAYIRFSFYNIRKNDALVTTDASTPDLFVKNIQLEVGSTASTFEAYKSQTQLISLGDKELAKIGNYQDRIYKDNDKWYLYTAIHKRVFTGADTENWGLANNVFYISHSLGLIADGTFTLSNRFAGAANQASTANVNTYNPDNSICGAKGGTSRYYIKCTNITSVDAFKQDLSTNNLITYYPYATPVITEITDTNLIQQLENVLAMTTYKNETNAFSIVASGNEESEIQVEYYQDIGTLINDLRTAFLSLGGNV